MVGDKMTVKSYVFIVAIASWTVYCNGEECTFDRLIPPEFCHSTTCPPQKNYKLRQQLCSYNCLDRGSYVCVENGEGEQVIEFCAQSLECEAGYKGSFIVDPKNQNKVIMKKEMCPNGTFQPHSSGCTRACKKKREFSALPERFKIHSLGDNVKPPTVYCDYTNGYYNKKNLTFVNYDDQFNYNFLNLCTNKTNPCAAGLTVLPNGSCTLPCGKNEARDESDFFICKHRMGTKSTNSQSEDVIIQTTNGLKIVTEEKKNETAGNTHNPNVESGGITTLTIGAVIIGCILLIMVTAIVIWYCLKQRRNQKSRNGDDEEQVPMQTVEPKATDESGEGVDTSDERAPALTKNINENGSTVTQANGHSHSTRQEANGLLTHNKAESGSKHLEGKKTYVKTGTKPSGEELKKKYNNTLSQAMLNSLTAQMTYVGALVIDGVPKGTVFMVGRLYVMTAFHVIRPVVFCDEDEEIHLERLDSDSIYVNFNQAVGDFHGIKSHLSCAYYNTDLDIAILKLSNRSDSTSYMYLYKGDISQGIKDVSVVGYGNQDQPFLKHLDPVCEIVPQNSQKILSAHAYLEEKKDYFKRKIPAYSETVDEGYQGYDSENVIIFDGYMEHGASGGPLLTNDNPASVKVVGALTHGMPECFYRLPAAEKENFPKEYRFHKACKMSSIFQALRTDKPDLAGKLFGN